MQAHSAQVSTLCIFTEIYIETTLKTAFESTMAALFKSTGGDYEMSDVILVDKKLYAIADDA
jgi:hypothetical protein